MPDCETELGNVDSDSRAVECLITQHLRINCPPPTSIQRLGRKAEKPRPLKVCLKSESDKASILKNARRLKEAPDRFNTVSLSSDMSREEREANKLLLAEARNLDLSEPSGDWIHLVRGAPGNRRILRVARRT